jgi:hypothetical protein
MASSQAGTKARSGSSAIRRGSIIGKSITILIPPERQDEEDTILQLIRRGDRIDHYETVRRGKDGVDISLTVSPVRGEAGKIVGASKIVRDISERKRSEALGHRPRDNPGGAQGAQISVSWN